MAMEEEGRENIALQDFGGGDVEWIGELAIDIDPTRSRHRGHGWH